MSVTNPFPLNITLKVDSPQLLAFLAQFGESKFASATDFNKIFQALDYLYENQGSGGSALFLGDFVSIEALQTEHPNPVPGNTANIIVELGNNDLAVWDNDDSVWIVYPGAGYSFSTPSFDETASVNPVTTANIGVGGLTITDKINFVTSLITAIRNISWQDKDGVVALTSDISALSQTIASKQSAELLLSTADVVQSGGIPQISGLTIQGHMLVQGSRVVVTGYNVPAFNGIYRVAAGPLIPTGQYSLARTSDANTTSALNNAIISITNGTQAGKTFRQTAVNPIIGTTAINFAEFGNSSVANATNILAGIAKLYNTIGTQVDGGITPNAVKVALDSKANLTQVGNLIREEFTFSGSQTFTLANNYGQIYLVIGNGRPLSLSQFTPVAPNQVTINDTLDTDDDVIFIYSNAIAGIQPYYSQAEVDALLSLKANNFYSLKVTTPSAYVTGTLSEAELLRVVIPANTFSANDIIKIPTCDFNKLGANGTWQTRIKLTTSPTMPAGATGTIALSPLNGATTLYGNFTRSFKINGGNLKGYSFLAGSFLDTSSALNVSSVAFDHTVTQYLYVSVTLSNIADQVRLEGIQLTNY